MNRTPKNPTNLKRRTRTNKTLTQMKSKFDAHEKLFKKLLKCKESKKKCKKCNDSDLDRDSSCRDGSSSTGDLNVNKLNVNSINISPGPNKATDLKIILKQIKMNFIMHLPLKCHQT